MNILQFSHFSPRYRMAGGIARHVELLESGLTQRGHRIHSLASVPLRDTGSADLNVSYVGPAFNRGPPLRFYLNLLRQYTHLRRAFRPDIVHIHSLSGLGLAIYECDIPVVTTIHAVNSVHEQCSWPRRIVRSIQEAVHCYQLREFLSCSERVIAVSEKTRRNIMDLVRGASMEHVEVLSPGVDTGRFRWGLKAEARESLGLGPGFLLLYVGRMVRQKHPCFLIEAVGALKNRIPDLQVAFVGEGPEEQHLREAARRHELVSRIYFAGAVQNRELPVFYQAADVFVNPTAENETFGLTTGEAMACGVPVVISQHGVRTGIVPPDLALVFAGVQDLAECIVRVYTDSEGVKRQVEKASRFVEQYAFTKTLARVEEIYREVMSRKQETLRKTSWRLVPFFALKVLDSSMRAVVHSISVSAGRHSQKCKMTAYPV